MLVSFSVGKQGGKILFISAYCGNLDNDNNYKIKKDFIKQPFPNFFLQEKSEWKSKGTDYFKPYDECFKISSM